MVATDEPGAVWIPSPFHWSGREGCKPRYVIIHGTAGGNSAEAIAGWFQNPKAQASTHYIIGLEGNIVQCVKESDAAWGNGALTNGHAPFWRGDVNPNLISISIEHVKPLKDNSDTLTEAQKQASFALIRSTCTRNSIPMREADASGGITGHFSIDPVNRSLCPGPYPWNELWAYLKGKDMNIPSGWKDNGTILAASNGVPVVRGFRKAVLASGNWDPGNVPLQQEQGIQGGTEQIFAYCTLRWTEEQGVFFWPTGPEILNLRQQLASLQGGDAEKYKTALERIKTIVQTL